METELATMNTLGIINSPVTISNFEPCAVEFSYALNHVPTNSTYQGKNFMSIPHYDVLNTSAKATLPMLVVPRVRSGLYNISTQEVRGYYWDAGTIKYNTYTTFDDFIDNEVDVDASDINYYIVILDIWTQRENTLPQKAWLCNPEVACAPAVCGDGYCDTRCVGPGSNCPLEAIETLPCIDCDQSKRKTLKVNFKALERDIKVTGCGSGTRVRFRESSWRGAYHPALAYVIIHGNGSAETGQAFFDPSNNPEIEVKRSELERARFKNCSTVPSYVRGTKRVFSGLDDVLSTEFNPLTDVIYLLWYEFDNEQWPWEIQNQGILMDADNMAGTPRFNNLPMLFTSLNEPFGAKIQGFISTVFSSSPYSHEGRPNFTHIERIGGASTWPAIPGSTPQEFGLPFNYGNNWGVEYELSWF